MQNDIIKSIQDNLPEVNNSQSILGMFEKGGQGSGRKKITIDSPMASHSQLHGKTYNVDKETEHEFSTGKKKYYHITDEKGNKHEIREDFIKK